MDFVSTIFKITAPYGFQCTVDSWLKSTSVNEDVKDLSSALKHAHRLVERSECWRLPMLIDKGVRDHPNKNFEHIDELLTKLKEAIYEAETVVDEFMYQDLKHKVEKCSLGTDEFKKIFNNLMSGFPSKVKNASDSLDKICKDMEKICDSYNIPKDPNEFSETARPLTSTFANTSGGSSLESMCGRENELSDILNLLGVPESGQSSRSRNVDAGESSDDKNHEGNFSVLSIVGIGGVGKTTLAQMVCKDERVESYFDLIIWVCVSNNFDLMKLTKEIIQSATNKSCDLTNLDSLQKNLKRALSSKRFLLVVDDVWSNEWQSLLGPMEGARDGSIIMVTTRSSNCVDLSGSGIAFKGNVNLEGLEENIYWEFFKSEAFGYGTTSNVDLELEVIGKEIAKRLKGSPLAAKTIGRLLSTRRDVSHWMQIKDSPIWQLRQTESEILPALQLSYQYLPSHLKKCFKYCALYPKDFKFTEWELTKLWIMQGFINLPEQITVTCGEPYIKEATEKFNELVHRCFFQKAADSKDEYVIHDLMHDVCQSLTKDECFCLENEDWEKSVNNNHNVWHLSIFRLMDERDLERLCKYEKLLSVRCVNWMFRFDTLCETLTCIRSLSLSKCSILQLPDNIGNLNHLKYLDISFNFIRKLPESFCKLYHLVFLNMEGCPEIKSFPEGFSKLVNLRFLYFPIQTLTLIYQMENHVIDMEKYLREIETKELNLCIGPKEKIENLKHMNRVGGIVNVFNIKNIPNKKTAEEADLKNKPLINELNLHWSQNRDGNDEGNDEGVLEADEGSDEGVLEGTDEGSDEGNDEGVLEGTDEGSDEGVLEGTDEGSDEGVLEALWPHPNLKILRIYHYGGRTLPSWFQKEFLSHLTHIRLDSCKQLTNLQDCLNPNQFPMLQVIQIVDCENLVSLPVQSFGGFASLWDLIITNCPKLTISNAMVLPASISRLVLISCGSLEKSIPSCLQNLTSLQILTIIRCSALVSIPAEATSNLKSVRFLTIEDCSKLQSIGGNNLKSLWWLSIKECAELQSLGGLRFLASLGKCNIRGCPKLAETGGQDIDGKLPPELLSTLPSTACSSE